MYENSVGERLKNKRLELKLSIEVVSIQTKINKSFIKAIEENNFKIFDSSVYAKGFIKNYANFLNMDEKNLIAIYKRDFEENSSKRRGNKTEKKEELNLENKKKEESNRFSLTPRKVALFLVILLSIFLIFLISKVINNAFSHPYLKITSPVELVANSEQNLEFFQNSISIKGETSANVTIKINGIPIILSEGNVFTTPSFPLSKSSNVINIVAINQLGMQSTIKLNINKSVATVSNPSQINAIITGINANTILTVYSDNSNVFDGQLHPDDQFPTAAKNKLEIKSSNINNISLTINNVSYKLTKTDQIFTILNGKISQE